MIGMTNSSHSRMTSAINNCKNVHLVGIAGVGMSGLAQLLAHEGKRVTGSDGARFPTLDAVERLNIPVTIGYDAKNVPPNAECVVHTDAAHEDNVERREAKRRGIPDLSYFEMLGSISVGRRTIAVSGTHGKTTTTGMLTKILVDAGAAPTAIIGSIVRDFGSNYVSGDPNLFVVEACEYRDHLLELSPEILVITNLEWDHTDYFPSIEAMQASFRKAVEKVPEGGTIVTNPNDPVIAAILTDAKARIVDYTTEPAYGLKLVGHFNVMNARAAAAAARVASEKVTNDGISGSLAAFQGSWRRFEYKGKTARGIDVYDDYAHHPTAIRETLQALRAKTAARIFVAFHPHLFSRTRDLLDDFAKAFRDADEVLIAPIYAAREKDDGTISNYLLAKKVGLEGRHARPGTFEEIERILATEPEQGDVIITMGAGDIYKVAESLVKN